MRIALVHPELAQRGGAESVVLWMARALRDRGHAVTVATRSFDPEAWPRGAWEGIALERLAAPRGAALLGRALRQRASARRLGRRLADAELAVCHNHPAPLWTARVARRRRTLRAVWFCEEPPARLHWRRSMPRVAEAAAEPERYPWLAEPLADWLRRDARRRGEGDRAPELEAVRSLDRRLANSRFSAERASAIYGCSFEACPLGVPEPGKDEPPPSPTPYVAWVTSPSLHKNAPGFLEALRIAVHEHGARDLRVRAVGLDPRRFGPAVAKAGLEETLRLEPPLDDAALGGLLGASRLVAVPPLDEPFGLVAVEAMARGRAVLASSVGGPAETVVHGETGLHAHPLDPPALAAALLELWNAPERCEALGAAGRERYRRHFTFDRFMERFLAAAL